MIVIPANLNTIPKKCNRCKYSYTKFGHRFCSVSFTNNMNKICSYKYRKTEKNPEHGKPDWCPLTEINTDKELSQTDLSCLEEIKINTDVVHVSY